MQITDNELAERIKDLVDSCDVDELCAIAGNIFGGNFYLSEDQSDNLQEENVYSFEPNENYTGEFDDIMEDDGEN